MSLRVREPTNERAQCQTCLSIAERGGGKDAKWLSHSRIAQLSELRLSQKGDGLFSLFSAPDLQLVKFIEQAILGSELDIVITHHPADTNNDHLQTSMACQEAVRLPQRQPKVKRIKEFWYMEVLSYTDWAINTAMNPFRPNCFVEIGLEGVQTKIAALGMYRDVMRPYPHPRSNEDITGLAAYRGGQWGLEYAEAFEVVLREY